MLRSDRLICFCVALLLVASFGAGCSSKQVVGPEKQPSETVVKVVFSPVKLNYHVVNPLTVRAVYKEPQWENDREVYIEGLLDKAVEDRINQNLKQLYVDIKELDVPPYRGIRIHVPQDSRRVDNRVHADISYSYNNVLSVFVRYDKSYYPPGSTQKVTVSGMETRNFDLTTGNEIRLQDVFADDVDYLAILSDAIKRALGSSATDENQEWYQWGPSLVAPFQGVEEGQKFFLSSVGISLLIDHRTPEFDIGHHFMVIPISYYELAGVVAIKARFYDETTTIYTSRAPLIMHLTTGYYDMPQITHRVEDQVGNVVFTAHYRYPAATTDAVGDYILRQHEKYEGRVAELKGQGGDNYWWISRNVWASLVGEFATVTVHEILHRVNSPITTDMIDWIRHGGEGCISSSSDTFVLDEHGNEVLLSQLFVHGFDYESVIRPAYEQALVGHHSLSRPTFAEVRDQLQFTLEATHLVLNTPLAYFSVSYEQIGCSNMTIFNFTDFSFENTK